MSLRAAFGAGRSLSSSALTNVMPAR